MSEAFNEEVEAFRKACDNIRLKMPGPDKMQALRELSEKQAGRSSKGTNMKVLFNRKTSTLMDPADVFAGEIDPLVHRTNLEKAEAILSQNRGLLQEDVEDEKGLPGTRG